jgi:hypothetical protein
MPGNEIGLFDEAFKRRLVADQTAVEVARIPVIQDVADVEDDGRDRQGISPGAP